MSKTDESLKGTAAEDAVDEASSRVIFAPIRIHRTFEKIIERIVEAIDAQGLRNGDRLPNEREMARLMEVSLPTLRQALRILETSGVLKVKPGQAGGVFVASEMVPIDVLGRNIAHEVDHIAELTATRRLLEPIVYHLAAEDASPQALDRIADTISLMEMHIDDPDMVHRADAMFHRRVAHAAGNRFLLQTMIGIYRDLEPLHGALDRDAPRARHMIDVHSRLLDTMRARDHARLDECLEETFVDLEAEYHVATRLVARWVVRPVTPGDDGKVC